MHPHDEAVLVRELLRDPAVLFIDGPRWKTVTPPATRDFSAIGSYCIIWSPEDLRELAAEFIPRANDWYCRSEHATIQLIRSRMGEGFLSEGRLAVSTAAASEQTAANVERRYKLLCRLIKKTYTNGVIQWRPRQADRSLWVGPAAMDWLANDHARYVSAIAGAAKGRIGSGEGP
jgi:hypothetical protein